MDTPGNKHKEGRTFDIMEKVLRELKSDDTKELFLNVMEKLLEFKNYQTPTSILKMEVIVMFLDLMLRNDSVYHYNSVFQKLEYFFMPTELRILAKHERIQLCSLLDEGNYGKVYLGKIGKSNDAPRVAVKVAKDNSPDDILLQEAKVMARLDHENVVKILAFQKKPSKIAMEFMEGNLYDVIKSHRFSSMDILKAIHDMALGMTYIAKKKYIHRDLDIRNIFVDSKKVCKIGDFGYARYVGYCPNGEFEDKVPIELLYLAAPESALNTIFSTKTDVWGFGILILCVYEISENLCPNEIAERFLGSLSVFLTKGILKFLRPKPCPERLYRYATEELLHLDAQRRPHFSAIEKTINEMLLSTT